MERATISIDEEGNAVDVVIDDSAYREAWHNFGRALFDAAAWICVARLALIRQRAQWDLIEFCHDGEPSPYWAGFPDEPDYMKYSEQEWEREKAQRKAMEENPSKE